MNSLRSYIETENITQAALAERLGIAPATLSLILSGSRNPGIELTKKISVVIT